ncbi:Mobile element protein [uncultured Gammaproteobacteria bacterium]|nr:Mobile element protein [uncultured Gammaproteobacteria bacterium]
MGERGQNENANGLLRQYLPKSMVLRNVVSKKVVEVLNRRPIKCLGWKTSYEVFEEFLGIDDRIFVQSIY